MLAELIVRLGEPIRDSRMSNKRLELLTDNSNIMFKIFPACLFNRARR